MTIHNTSLFTSRKFAEDTALQAWYISSINEFDATISSVVGIYNAQVMIRIFSSHFANGGFPNIGAIRIAVLQTADHNC